MVPLAGMVRKVLVHMGGHNEDSGTLAQAQMDSTGGHPMTDGLAALIQQNWGPQVTPPVLGSSRTQGDVLPKSNWTPTELDCSPLLYEACD
jgi:hypothetical protein